MNYKTNIWVWHPPKGDPAITKERPNFLLKRQAKVYYGLKMMARKFRKYRII